MLGRETKLGTRLERLAGVSGHADAINEVIRCLRMACSLTKLKQQKKEK
jgi:hypothetical protein